MLLRRVEPELMTGTEQVQAYAAADFSQPHSNLIRHFQRIFPSLSPGSKVIDLGCGPADIAIRIAHLYTDFSVDAVDGSKAMLDQAAKALAKAKLASRVRLIRAVLPDLSALTFTRYDIVVSNSLLHHLHDPQTLWQTIKTVAKAKARVFIADLKRPDSDREARLMVKKYAASEPEILRHDFYHSLLAAFTLRELHAQIREAGLDLNIETASDRHVIISGEITGPDK